MNACGALGGVKGALARTAALPVAFSSVVAVELAVNVCWSAGTGAQGDPSVYWTLSASVLPELSCSDADLTSTAKLNSRTALPALGGTKLAAIVSILVGLLGGQSPFATTSKGPGVMGILVGASSVTPVPLSLIVMVPAPPVNTLTQPEKCEKR